MNETLDFLPLLISLKTAAVSTIILFAAAFPLACLMAFRPVKGRGVIEAFFNMPTVIPPTVLGFYLLVLFSPMSPVGGFLETVFGIRLVFSFSAIVIACCVFCFPFMYQPLRNGLSSVEKSLVEASYTLGRGRLHTLGHVIIPNCRSILITAPIMTFAHTLGAFGIVLMVGGNIPGQTRTASIAIYEEVEKMNYGAANLYSLILIGICMVILVVVNYIGRGIKKSSPPKETALIS